MTHQSGFCRTIILSFPQDCSQIFTRDLVKLFNTSLDNRGLKASLLPFSKLVTIAVLPSRRRQQISNGAQLPDVLRVRSSASFRLANLAANIHPRCSRPTDFTKPSPGNAARVFDHHLYMYVMAALSRPVASPSTVCAASSRQVTCSDTVLGPSSID